MPELSNAKYEAFAQEYIIDFNGAQAAIRAGYSEKTARTQASKLLTIPDISERVAELMQDRCERTQVDADYVLNRLHQIDQLDILDILTEDFNEFKPLNEWPKQWRISISGMDMSEIWEYNADSEQREIVGVLKKIKWPDKTKNLEWLGKHVGVDCFNNRVKVDTAEPISFNMNFGTG